MRLGNNIEKVEPKTHLNYNKICLTDQAGKTSDQKTARKLWSKNELAIVLDTKELNSALTGREKADLKRRNTS